MLHTSSTSSSMPHPLPAPRDIRALLLDDSSFDRARIRRLSQKTKLSIELDEVDSIEQLDRAVAKADYDLILIDYRLPVGDGMEALDLILRNDLNRDAGKIMITGDGARQTVVQAMRSGCHDFLTKEEMDVEALRGAILNALNAAHARQTSLLHLEEQKEVIRQGLVAAMQDSEVQGNVVSLVQSQLRHLGITPDQARSGMAVEDLEALLADAGDRDRFTFH